MSKTFLEAEWRKLAMVNYSIDSKILDKYLPPKTEIDLWNNTCYVSLVGFLFKDTKVKGLKIPFHTNFEEVNLRFYVRYKDKRKMETGGCFHKRDCSKTSVNLCGQYHLQKRNTRLCP